MNHRIHCFFSFFNLMHCVLVRRVGSVTLRHPCSRLSNLSDFWRFTSKTVTVRYSFTCMWTLILKITFFLSWRKFPTCSQIRSCFYTEGYICWKFFIIVIQQWGGRGVRVSWVLRVRYSPLADTLLPWKFISVGEIEQFFVKMIVISDHRNSSSVNSDPEDLINFSINFFKDASAIFACRQSYFNSVPKSVWSIFINTSTRLSKYFQYPKKFPIFCQDFASSEIVNQRSAVVPFLLKFEPDKNLIF